MSSREMEGSQKVAEGSEIGAHAVCVKTKSGCENTIFGQNFAPEGGVGNDFSENSSDLGHYFLPSPPEKR